MSGPRRARTDHPVHDLIAERWSPYGLADESVPESDLRSLFEAARWAASSYNEQPWAYFVARKENTAAFGRMLSCLVEPNQAWARSASALALGVVRSTFSRNGKPNAHAWHDLGLASGNLSLEATSRGLVVHQMAGILPDRVREHYALPDDAVPATALAIGRAKESGDEALRERDAGPRSRKALGEFLFGNAWGEPSELAG